MQDPRLTGRHIKVAWVIIDRYMQVKGDARASARYLQRATGMSSRTVVKACHELTEWGYFTQRLGSGTRPTEFTPKWSTVSPMYNAKAIEPSVVPVCNASVSPMYNANESSVVPMCNESYLLSPAYEPDLQEVEIGSAASATPPLAAGLAPAAGETPQVGEVTLAGFDALWGAYGWKQKRAQAKAAYAKLAPDRQTHDEMVAAAARWHQHYADHNIKPRWRVMLHNWIAGERWQDDLPIIQSDAKSAAISNVRGRARKAAIGSDVRAVRIVSAETIGSPFDDFFLKVRLADEKGSNFEHQLHIVAARAKYGEGPDKAAYHSLMAATRSQSESDLVGKLVLLRSEQGRLKFSAIRNNDNDAIEDNAA